APRSGVSCSGDVALSVILPYVILDAPRSTLAAVRGEASPAPEARPRSATGERINVIPAFMTPRSGGFRSSHALLAGALLAGLTACGGSSNSDTGPTPSDPSV